MGETDFEVGEDGKIVESSVWERSKEKKLLEAAKRAVSKITPKKVAEEGVSLAFSPSPFIYGPEAWSGPPPQLTPEQQQLQQVREQVFEGSPSYIEHEARASSPGKYVLAPASRAMLGAVEAIRKPVGSGIRYIVGKAGGP